MQYEYMEVKTEQNIFLNGFHAKEGHKSCVLFIPGLAGSFMESKFARELAKACLENEIDFLFAHNQDSFQIISFIFLAASIASLSVVATLSVSGRALIVSITALAAAVSSASFICISVKSVGTLIQMTDHTNLITQFPINL